MRPPRRSALQALWRTTLRRAGVGMCWSSWTARTLSTTVPSQDRRVTSASITVTFATPRRRSRSRIRFKLVPERSTATTSRKRGASSTVSLPVPHPSSRRTSLGEARRACRITESSTFGNHRPWVATYSASYRCARSSRSFSSKVDSSSGVATPFRIDSPSDNNNDAYQTGRDSPRKPVLLACLRCGGVKDSVGSAMLSESAETG